MFRKTVSLALAVLLFSIAGAQVAYAKTNEEKAERLAAKVKAGVAKLGVGREAQVELKLYDKTKLKGYIGEAGEKSFIVVDAKTGEASTVNYSSVEKIKGKNRSLGVKIAIGVAIAAAIVVALVVIIGLGFRARKCDSRVLGEC